MAQVAQALQAGLAAAQAEEALQPPSCPPPPPVLLLCLQLALQLALASWLWQELLEQELLLCPTGSCWMSLPLP